MRGQSLFPSPLYTAQLCQGPKEIRLLPTFSVLAAPVSALLPHTLAKPKVSCFMRSVENTSQRGTFEVASQIDEGKDKFIN